MARDIWLKCLLISTQGKSQTPRLDRAQYRVPQVSCHAYTGETEGLTAVSPGFQTEKWLLFSWDLAQKKEDVRKSLSVCQSLGEPCQNLTKSPRTVPVSLTYDGTTMTTPAVLEAGSLPGQTKRGDRFPSPRGVQEGAARAARSTRNQPNRLRKLGERATRYVTTVQRGDRRWAGAGRLVPTSTKGGPGAHHHKGGPGTHQYKGG